MGKTKIITDGPKIHQFCFTVKQCPPQDENGIANCVDPDQTAPCSLIWVCTVCTDLYVPILGIYAAGMLICKLQFPIRIKEVI